MAIDDENESILLSLGWFRSGTTHLYEHLKASLPDWTHYYEPFHPNLGGITSQYEQLTAEKTEKDVKLKEPTHNKILFDEYCQNPGPVKKYHRPEFGKCNFFLGGGAEYPELRKYLNELVGDRKNHLQINRGLGRLQYLFTVLPTAKFLLIIRDPRATWASWQNQPDNPLAADLEANKFQIKQMLKELRNYLTDEDWTNWGFSWAKRKPPVAEFLITWSFLYTTALNHLQKAQYYSVITFEALVTSSAAVKEKLAGTLGLPLKPATGPSSYSTPNKKWRRAANPEDYRKLFADAPDDLPLFSLLKQFGWY